MRVQHSSGFTLVELVVVLAILFVLAVIVYPVFTRVREGHPPNCLNHQRQLAISLLSDAQDNNETLSLPSNWVAASKLQSDPKLFGCPTNTHRGSPVQPDYGMNAFLYDKDLQTGKKIGVPYGAIADPSLIELTADIKRPTGTASQTVNSRPSNPFPDSYTVTGYFGARANADWRHSEGIIVSYVDGHVSRVRPEELLEAGRTRYNIPIGEKPAEGRTR